MYWGKANLIMSSLNYLFISLWNYGYLFYSLDHNPILYYFIAQTVLGCLVSWNSFISFLCPFNILSSWGLGFFCLFVLSTSLLFSPHKILQVQLLKSLTQSYNQSRSPLYFVLWTHFLKRIKLVTKIFWIFNVCQKLFKSGKESACQCTGCRRQEFNPWVRKIPRRRKWQSTLLFYSPMDRGA